jgi:Uma2 family endonuclease
MGSLTPQEALVLRWAELCADPRFADFAGKIELNRFGVIEMSPANNRHGMKQAIIAQEFGKQLRDGQAIVECNVLTTEGVRVPDVAWASKAFMARHGQTNIFPVAPEICVEVRSPWNTDAEMEFKTHLFLEAGAVEVWIVAEDGSWKVYDERGAQPATRYGVTLEFPAA